MALIDNFTEKELRQMVKESVTYKEVLIKLGYKTFGGNNNKTLQDRLRKYNIDTSHFTTRKAVTRTTENVFCKNSTASQAVVRKWFKKGNYVDYKCAICGLINWQNKELTLQLDHINGDNSDDRLENLRWLCPNCHSQTETFCGRKTKKKHNTLNGVKIGGKKFYCIDCGTEVSYGSTRCMDCYLKNNRKDRPTKEELEQMLIEYNGNFEALGRKFNLNGNSIRKWCKGYNMPYHSKDYKR